MIDLKLTIPSENLEIPGVLVLQDLPAETEEHILALLASGQRVVGKPLVIEAASQSIDGYSHETSRV